MTIAPLFPAFKSLGKDWIYVMTASVLAALLALGNFVRLPDVPHWISWCLFIATLCWAFFRSWNREHSKVLILTREFVAAELRTVRRDASASAIVFDSKDRELNFYFDKIGAAGRGINKKLLSELLAISKQTKRI